MNFNMILSSFSKKSDVKMYKMYNVKNQDILGVLKKTNVSSGQFFKKCTVLKF